MNEKATIYDYVRMCKHYNNSCKGCPMHREKFTVNAIKSTEEIDEMNEIILKWCKERPVKTRQDKFLEMFPNARTINGIIDICPRCDCAKTNCIDCAKSYWLEEVED